MPEDDVGFMVITEGTEEYYGSEADLLRRHRMTGRSLREGDLVTEGGRTYPAHVAAREELQGRPELEGLAGPMWGGVQRGMKRARYEAWSIYERLSS